MEERAVLFRFSTFLLNNGRLHQIVGQGAINHDNIKKSAVLRTFDVQSLNFCVEGKTSSKRRLYIQVYDKSDCVSVNDRWISFDGKYRSVVVCWRNNLLYMDTFFGRPLGLY